MRLIHSLLAVCCLAAAAGAAQAADRPLPDVAALVKAFKEDPRGPYQAIRWFCPDGTTRPAQSRCPEPGGFQHALPKVSVQGLARDHGLYLGQILAGTPYEEFWDTRARNARARQYVLERYLVATDDGWILRKARYYRGAFQIEDEETWGRGFLAWLVADDANLAERFFLVRQLAQWVPHHGGDDRLVRIRSAALAIAERDPRFMNLRIKIHSQPDAGDLGAVADYRQRHAGSLTAGTDSLLAGLQADLDVAYHTPATGTLTAYRPRLKTQPVVLAGLDRALAALEGSGTQVVRHEERAGCEELADLLWLIRDRLPLVDKPVTRLLLLDLSLDTERALFRRLTAWQADDLQGLVARARLLVRAAAGAGFLEIWEWQAVAAEIAALTAPEAIRAADLVQLAACFGRTVEWSTGLVAATFEPALHAFSFEPLAAGFVDASLRSSILLALGESVDQLARTAAAQLGTRSRLMDLGETGGIRGVNPGYARGRLEVVTGSPEQVTFLPDRIYALSRPPADLSPVAGIFTVSEGNPVSHIQLLARNLGIPNAVLANRHLNALLPHDGSEVFYAVSPRGAVLLKPAAEMTAAELALVATDQRKEEMVQVPVDRIDLAGRRVLNLRDLRATDSGRLCGPKAANLGQLKSLFPEQVVEGVVIPFGIFRAHLGQTIPGQDVSYWAWLQAVFARAEQERQAGVPAAEVEGHTLADLARFREMIGRIDFLPDFVADLDATCVLVLGSPLGEVPVFIRSDTNMEDLRDFTGAGLNLTLFNVRERETVLQGIRQVWASPYSERSFRWRQRYLLNPENVYPSVLLMPAVNVEKSGVMITTGVSSGLPLDNTVAFNRGVAGAVEGQVAESYLLRADGRDELLSPSREVVHTVLPVSGGLAKQEAGLNEPILGESDRRALRDMAGVIRARLAPIVSGPLDVELGLMDGRIWLFQVRPFVENRKAQGSVYLLGLDEGGNDDLIVPWQAPLAAKQEP